MYGLFKGCEEFLGMLSRDYLGYVSRSSQIGKDGNLGSRWALGCVVKRSY